LLLSTFSSADNRDRLCSERKMYKLIAANTDEVFAILVDLLLTPVESILMVSACSYLSFIVSFKQGQAAYGEETFRLYVDCFFQLLIE